MHPTKELLDYYGMSLDEWLECDGTDQAIMLTTPIKKDGDVCCREHGTVYGDEDLIAAICDANEMTVAEFKQWPLGRQHDAQDAWVNN